MNLTNSQSAALKYIEDYARYLESIGQNELDNVLLMSNISDEDFNEANRKIAEHSQVALHFHPDRVSRDGETVIEAFLKEGVYKNQFETHLSSGGLDPTPEGLRVRWEDNLFGGVFSAHKAPLSERPKYGSLDLMLFPDGPSPRYGSCYLLLKPEVTRRCTFTYMDSHRAPHERGTLKAFEPIMGALMTESFERRFALGKNDTAPPALIQHLISHLGEPTSERLHRELGRNLNHYIEAQVHGDILMDRDVGAFVADPSFRAQQIGSQIIELCEKNQIELIWHHGFRIYVSDVPDDFRGATMPSLAKRIAKSDYVDASLIGKACLDLKENPENWSDRGAEKEVLQELKCLWHVLVHFGEPI